jgi:hypothetical protein
MCSHVTLPRAKDNTIIPKTKQLDLPELGKSRQSKYLSYERCQHAISSDLHMSAIVYARARSQQYT